VIISGPKNSKGNRDPPSTRRIICGSAFGIPHSNRPHRLRERVRRASFHGHRSHASVRQVVLPFGHPPFDPPCLQAT
jgi:hypothetical protein